MPVRILTDAPTAADTGTLPAGASLHEKAIHALRKVFGDAASRIVIANTKGLTGHAMGVGIEDVVAIKALETVEIGRPVRLVTDSEYLIKGCLEWLRSWKRRNWITASGTKVMNRDLWERLDELVQVHTIEFQHIKGHTGHKQNELCDNACTQAMNAAWNGPQDLIPVDHNSPNAPAAA